MLNTRQINNILSLHAATLASHLLLALEGFNVLPKDGALNLLEMLHLVDVNSVMAQGIVQLTSQNV